MAKRVPRIGIIGKGFVGSAVQFGFSPNTGCDAEVRVYDKDPSKSIDTLEDTVNKSSKAQYQKDRRRSKRKTRSDERYADWRERFARREDVKEKIQSGKRKVVDVVTGGTDYDYDPNKTDVQEGQYGAFWKRKTKK